MVNSAKEYAYGNMRKNEYCPVCHSNIFSYKYINQYSLALFINCKYCHTYYELFRYYNDDWKIYKAEIANYYKPPIVKIKERTLKEIFEYMKNK